MVGRITPARKLLFATGHFLHDYIVRETLARSPYAKYVYANWTCEDFSKDGDHDIVQDTYGNVITRKCKCGKPLTEHNELEVEMPYLVGHIDLVFLINEVYHIREFKTYDRKDIPFDDLSSVLPEHRLQVSCYRKLLSIKAKKEGRRVSTTIVVEYIDRSNSKLFGGKPYKSLVCKAEPDKNLSKIKNAVDHFGVGARTGKLPDRICPNVHDRRAKECSKAIECFARRNSNVGTRKIKPLHKGDISEIHNRVGRSLKKQRSRGARQSSSASG